MKYYHPAVATGDNNWDYELFRILPRILDSNNKTKRNAILSNWVDGLGPLELNEPDKPSVERVKPRPDLSWINNRILGDKLARQLNVVRNAKREVKNYYETAKGANFKVRIELADGPAKRIDGIAAEPIRLLRVRKPIG